MTQIEVFAYKAFFIGAAVVLALFIWLRVRLLPKPLWKPSALSVRPLLLRPLYSAPATGVSTFGNLHLILERRGNVLIWS